MKNKLILVILATTIFIAGNIVGYFSKDALASSVSGCDIVNSIGTIDIYYCVDPYNGFGYYINSVGFMPSSFEK